MKRTRFILTRQQSRKRFKNTLSRYIFKCGNVFYTIGFWPFQFRRVYIGTYTNYDPCRGSPSSKARNIQIQLSIVVFIAVDDYSPSSRTRTPSTTLPPLPASTTPATGPRFAGSRCNYALVYTVGGF